MKRLVAALLAAALTGCRSPTVVETGRDGPAADSAFGALLAEMGVRYLPGEGRVQVSGWVNMQSGLVEVFACAPEGKMHESVVVLDCVPSGLHAGLLALGLEPGTPVEHGTEADYKPPTGDEVIVEVRWQGPDGRLHTARAEDWIWNAEEERTMPHVAWIFTGSFMQSVTGDPQDATYGADYVKSLVTTYHDPTTILENPLAQGRDDTLYYVNEKAVPAGGTPVTVMFRQADSSAEE